ncbi:MAG: SPOR domain-containing protein [Candidatus Riflebacteria bacterium]|nr:SPOR domain-containing protein [Candidatus Riflebacteria bacterium]
MSETSGSDSRNAAKRQFDWGPPASPAGDTFKDWLVYLIILVLLSGGVWALLDINGRQDDAGSAPVPLRTVASSTDTVPASVSVRIETTAPVAVAPASRFFVQLGAFPDEASAREIFNQLEAEGFEPTLAEPDAQFEIYRIFVGPYPDEAAAEDVAEKLNAIDFHCFVIEQP